MGFLAKNHEDAWKDVLMHHSEARFNLLKSCVILDDLVLGLWFSSVCVILARPHLPKSKSWARQGFHVAVCARVCWTLQP